MEADVLLRRVAAALTEVRDPRTGEDVLSSGRVRDLRLEPDGVVRFRFALRGDDPGALVRHARRAAEAVEGVRRVKVDVELPADRAPARPAPRPTLPTPDPELLPRVAHVVAISSGKGGVGKSTVAANLAAALADLGHRVGLLDADVYGPDIPRMFGEERRPRVVGPRGHERLEPLEAWGVRLMSLGFLLEPDQPAIFRGPLVAGVLRQFLQQVEWGPLDFLLVDLPPGTGDAQLSLVQLVTLDGVIMVTTPQEVATQDVRRGVRMFQRVGARVLGVIENMSAFVCPDCGAVHPLFGAGGGQRLAEELGVSFLGAVPLEAAVREGGDAGTPVVRRAPDSAAAQALRTIATHLAATAPGRIAAVAASPPA